MFKLTAILGFVAAATAASWPMVTVNSSGNLVLNSPTKAGSFQLNAVSVSAAPTTAGTASLTTVTALDADTDAFIVSIPTSPATSAGFKLPAATEGRQIRFYNSGSAKGAFTIWTSSTSVFIDGTSATTVDIAATTSYVVATATSSTNWVIQQNSAASGLSNKGFATIGSATAAATLSAANMQGGVYTITPTATAALTTASAATLTAADSNSANGDSYTFTVTNAGTQALTTDLSVTLTAGTGVTVPTDGTQLIVPGQTRTYMAYRTSASAWTVVQISSYMIHPTALAAAAATAGDNSATAVTAHATRWSVVKTFSAAAQAESYTNNYAAVGDIVNIGQTAAFTAGVSGYFCTAAASAVTCRGFGATGATGAASIEFFLVKA